MRRVSLLGYGAGVRILTGVALTEGYIDELFVGDDMVEIVLPCGHEVRFTREDFPRESVPCPNEGKCGARECWVVQYMEPWKP